MRAAVRADSSREGRRHRSSSKSRTPGSSRRRRSSSRSTAPARSLARDADLYVDALYAEAPRRGRDGARGADVPLRRSTSTAESGTSTREVVEGARADVRLHHGLVWRTTSDGEPALSRRLTRARARGAARPRVAPLPPRARGDRRAESARGSASPWSSPPTRCRASSGVRDATPSNRCEAAPTWCPARAADGARPDDSSTPSRSTPSRRAGPSGTTTRTPAASRPSTTGGRPRASTSSRSSSRAGSTSTRRPCARCRASARSATGASLLVEQAGCARRALMGAGSERAPAQAGPIPPAIALRARRENA